MKTARRLLKKLKIELAYIYHQAIPLPDIYPKKLKTGSQRDTCTSITVALLTIAKRWKQPKSPSMDEWIKKMWSTHTVKHYTVLKLKGILSHATTWINPEDIMLHETRESQKHRHCMVPFI